MAESVQIAFKVTVSHTSDEVQVIVPARYWGFPAIYDTVGSAVKLIFDALPNEPQKKPPPVMKLMKLVQREGEPE